VNNAIYSATTGMINRSRAMDVTATNLANMNTAGYKRDRLITSAFSERVALRLDDQGGREIGDDTHGAIAEELITDYGQGVVETTGRSLDFAIIGDGFFSIETEGGQEAATRDGSFQVDPEGFLRTATGGYVMGEGGRIEVGTGAVTIDDTGVVYSDGQQVDKLAMLAQEPPEEGAQPQPIEADKLSPNALTRPAGEGTFAGRIVQGRLERSNVDMVEEMSQMMAASRAYQSCAQAVRIIDAATQKTVNEIARM
jgi:flagellar basal-body rod protein FlgG